MKDSAGIYVEILIRTDVEEVWRRSQNPGLHQQWDLRFSTIEYQPRASEAEAQKFLYETRIGFGLKISGEGESKVARESAEGVRSTSLSFWSDDAKSLIREGAGYWRYVPVADGVRFLTWYDYRTRFGVAGKLADRYCFRPLMGWATAWSFDRLRLWIEDGVPPETTMRLAVIHGCARLAIAFTWLWHGLVPKLLFPSLDEKAMLLDAGLSIAVLPLVGLVEVLIGVLVLALWRARVVFVLNVLAMVMALGGVSVQSPAYLWAAFNPVSLNLGMIALSVMGYLSSEKVPTASRCLRRRSV